MTFLTTAFLMALPLAAAPLLLHLFDRRRNVVIDWGAMEFLMEAVARKTSARKLKQWILLLLRVLAVAALVLALAQPLMPGNWFGNTDRSEVIFVIDNSMSTLRKNGAESTLYSEMIARATEEVEEAAAGDYVRIMAASPYPVWVTAGGMRVEPTGSQNIVGQFEAVRPTNGSSDLLAALFTAVQADSAPTVRSRRIVLLTDGQAADWKTGDEKGWQRFQETLKVAHLPTTLDVVQVAAADARTANVAIGEVRSNRTVVGVDQTFTVTAEVTNHSGINVGASNIRWFVDGVEEFSDLLPDIGGGESQDIILRHSFAKPGVYAITCQTDVKDSLSSDNSGSVVVEVVNEVPVLLVESNPGRAEMQQDAFFIEAAMGYPNGEAQPTRGVHQPEKISPVGLERADLTRYRAVIVPSLRVLSEETIIKLRDFVYDGGGLWLALGPRTDIEHFNQFLFHDGDGLSPLALDGVVDEADTQTRRTTINPSLKDHPAIAELADTDRLDTADVKVTRRIRFVPPPQDEDVSILLNLTNGEPLAVEKYLGRGRVIVQGVPLRMDQWSGLGKSQAFVVMAQDWMSYLTQPQATRHNLSPGDPIAVHLADSEHESAILRTPHGDEIDLTADVVGNGVVFRSSRTILPGDYSLELGLSGDRIPFHVRRNPTESDLAVLTTEDEELLASTAGLSQDLLDSGMSAASQGNPIWPLLLMALIGFITVELILSGLIARERFGTEAISETSEAMKAQDMGIPMAFGSKKTLSDTSVGTAATTSHSKTI